MPKLPAALVIALSFAWIASAAAVQTTFVPIGATWSYLDNGSDPGAVWRTLGFNDNLWSSGPSELGYGDGDEATLVSYGPNSANKYVTTYFRQEFQVVGAATYTSLLLRVKRDDGVVLYVNGTEVARSNMPGGAISASTLASSTVGGAAESTFSEFSVSPGLLIDGTNVLAAEVHQDSVTSSDISFAAELIGSDTAAQIVRGPYLQSGSSTGVHLLWRTNAAVDARVWYGTDFAALGSVADDVAVGTEHAVSLAGLAPDTRYYYAVGTSTSPLIGGDAQHYFVTAPASDARRDVRLWAIGDAGTATNQQRAVRDAYDALVGDRAPHLWMMLGDNAYNSGTDAEFENAVFDMYERELESSVLWPTLGNHDGGSADSATQTGPYYDIFDLPGTGEAGGEPSGTEAYYAFDYGNMHFICLESFETDRSVAGAMLTWLEADLQSVVLRPTPPEWIVAFWHHPPYSKGSHNSDTETALVEMRQNALPILEAYGVDLVLGGHSHSYERSFLIDGHYGLSGTLTGAMILDGGDGRPLGDGAYQKATLGPSPHEGAVYVVAGSSGQISGGSLNHPAMYASLNTLGSLLIDVDRNVLEARFLDANGIVQDTFRLVKGGLGQVPLHLCSATARSGCRAPQRARLTLVQGANETRDRLVFKWLRGHTETSELGDPRAGTDYALCIYDQNGAWMDMHIASDPLLWKSTARGFRFRDPTAAQEGALRLALGGRSTASNAIVRGRGAALGDPTLPAVLPVTAQVVNSDTGVCWSATFSTAVRNDAGVLRLRSP